MRARSPSHSRECSAPRPPPACAPSSALSLFVPSHLFAAFCTTTDCNPPTHNPPPQRTQHRRDEPLQASMQKLADRLGLLAERMSLIADGDVSLALHLSPRELGLAADSTIVAAERAAPAEVKHTISY